MNNKTVVFDVQAEIAELKTKVANLEATILTMKSVQNQWHSYPPIYGPAMDRHSFYMQGSQVEIK